MTDRTHWQDCWREHHACAVAEVERLRDTNTRLREELLAAMVWNAERQAAIAAELERLRGIARASGRQA